jgi:hypothetical protein
MQLVMRTGRLPRSSIRQWGIVAVVLASCALLIAAEIIHAIEARQATLAAARAALANLSRSLAVQTKATFENAENTLNVIAKLVVEPAATLTNDGGAHSLLAAQKAGAKNIRAIGIVDETGTPRVSADSQLPPPGANYSQRDYFIYHRDTPGTASLIGVPVVSKVDGLWLITVSRRLSLADGSFGGVAFVSFNATLFQNLFESFDLGVDGNALLVRDDGIVLVRRPYDAANIGRDLKNAPIFANEIRNNIDGIVLSKSTIDGNQRYNSFRWVDGFPLIVSVGVTQSDALAAWRSAVLEHASITAVAIVVLLGLGVAAFYLSRRGIAGERRFVAETLRQNDQLQQLPGWRRTPPTRPSRAFWPI